MLKTAHFCTGSQSTVRFAIVLAFRGQGVGRRFLQELIARATPRRPKITTTIPESYINALNMLCHCGFGCQTLIRDAFTGPKENPDMREDGIRLEYVKQFQQIDGHPPTTALRPPPAKSSSKSRPPSIWKNRVAEYLKSPPKSRPLLQHDGDNCDSSTEDDCFGT